MGKTMDVRKLDRMGAILREYVEQKEIAGGNVCVLHYGEEIYYAQEGFADIATGRKIQRDSLFRLYSMTKPVTSAAVMLLIERGIIDLLDPIGKYIPSFVEMTVVSENGEVPAQRCITIKDCLSMTAGLAYNCDPDPASHDAAKVFEELDKRMYSQNPMTTLEVASKLGEGRLAFQPGTQWRYSTCADVLGAVVEAASGLRFGTFLEKEFFEPLGMNDTGFAVPKEKRDRLTTVYEKTADGLTQYNGNHLGICNHMDVEICYESGGAGLVSTIEDYKHFAQMLLNKGSYCGKRILSPATVAFMTNGHLLPSQQAPMQTWESLAGYTYGNLMRILTDPSLAVYNGFMGEYGWDGWLGPYFANIPQEDLVFLMMVQLRDAGTFSLTRKLRNVLAAALE